jgi:class 3 adenylate cyclase
MNRLLLLITAPIVVGALLVAALSHQLVTTRLSEEATRMGESITDLMAVSIGEHLVNDDLLSVNVILAEMGKKGYFETASVYAGDKLVAQSGRGGVDLVMYSAEINYQNAVLGYVQVGRDNRWIGATVNLMVGILLGVQAALAAAAFWFARGTSTAQPVATPSETEPPRPQTSENDEVVALPIATELPLRQIVLVMKIRPERLLMQHLQAVQAALDVFRGQITMHEGDEVTARFEDPTDAIHTALLVGHILSTANPGFSVNSAVHVSDPDAWAEARKHASHLASVSAGHLLASEQLKDQVGVTHGFILKSHQSAMIGQGDGEADVYTIEAGASRSLIERHARRMMEDGQA